MTRVVLTCSFQVHKVSLMIWVDMAFGRSCTKFGMAFRALEDSIERGVCRIAEYPKNHK
jgi:hypothetical protein